MQPATFLVLAAVLAVALAAGQYYVPRAYYTIDSAGHESLPVPLRRLRRSFNPYPAPAPAPGGSWSDSQSGASAWSKSGAGSNGGGGGGWYPPPAPGGYGASAPGAGFTRGVSGTFGPGGGLGSGFGGGRVLSASSAVGMNSNGQGYYDTKASLSH